MSVKNIISIIIIFAIACGGWWILGANTHLRSYRTLKNLGNQVHSLWGEVLVQQAPSFSVEIPGSQQVRWIMPSQNKVEVELNSDYRKKGLIWYPTYTCKFKGIYTITNTEKVTQKIRFHFDFPSKGGTYDSFGVLLDEKRLLIPIDTHEGIGEIMELAPGDSKKFTINYLTRGISQWQYNPDRHVGRVQNLDLTVTTDFFDIDYTEGSLSSMNPKKTATGMSLQWKATDLISRQGMGVIIPEKLNPGPLTTRITFFAPICLLFFFVLVSTIGIMYKIDIHPMHYLFVASGFFAFHLLLSYMVGLIFIHIAFAISAIVSVFLVTAYLSAALGKTFPWKIAAAGQIFFLVLFSYTFFFKGITGLTVAVGSVITLAILMKVTAHVDWNQVFEKKEKITLEVSSAPEES